MFTKVTILFILLYHSLIVLKQDLESLFVDFRWNFKGILDVEGRLHDIPRNSTCITAIIEQMALERIYELKKWHDCEIILAENTRQYPDATLTGGTFGNSRVAVDIKTARRLRGNERKISGFTIGSYAGYFLYPNQKKPGCRIPYQKFSEHWIVGFIYDWDARLEVSSMVSIVDVIVQEKWRIASKSTGTGTTKHIGSIRDIDDLKNGNGPFKTKEEFEAFWRNFGVQKEEAKRR